MDGQLGGVAFLFVLHVFTVFSFPLFVSGSEMKDAMLF
jgi:hypothetical protein